ncbi:MAG: carbon-nitrogen hydrolase family protein [Bacteroidales bacterium]|nr:carbon-nitrogen hydrolase family protein [Bacteroidales bacterium]
MRILNQTRLPREVCVASISLKGLWPEKSIEKRITDILERMERVYPFEPDIICLPETFQISWVEEMKTLDEIAEDENIAGAVTARIAEMAKKHNCYIVCPIVTKKEGHFYNSSILLNRVGEIAGVYHKIHPTDTETLPDVYYKGGGITPGALLPPVFKTDFGTIGMQICMDASWFENWRLLKEAGAEMVLFPSQGPFGDTLVHHAWMNQYYIVSATGEDARILDITGDVVASDGEFARWVCATVNLEKAFLEIWPQVQKFGDIEKKYGQRIRIKIYHPENWATIESRDPDLKVKDILDEFSLPTLAEQIREATEIQDKYRLK